MSLGPQTAVIDGQRNTLPQWYQWSPQGYGPQTTGVPQVSPTMPPFIGQANTTGFSGAGAMGGADGSANGLVAALGAQNPHSLKVSPVWWAVIALIVGLVLLKGVHWRETTLEGFEERGRFGGAREEAREEV